MTVTEFDAIGVDALRDAGSVKWTMFPGTIGAFVAEMDFGIAPAVRDAIVASVDGGLTGYLPNQVGDDLRAATVERYRDAHGWTVAPEQVRIVPDVIAAFEAAITHFSAPGSAIIVPTPAYMPFLMVPPAHGREVIQVPMLEQDGRSVLDLEAIGAAFEAGAGLFVLCNPHNPLGTVSTREEMIALSEVVEAYGGRVFSDEIHAPIVFEGEHVPYASVSPAAEAHTVTATSASKAWNLAGLKCAQMILSNPADRELWSKVGFLVEHGAANQGVVANTAAYREGQAWLDGVVDYLDGNRRAMAEVIDRLMPGVGYRAPEGTYIAWFDFTRYGIEGDLGEYFRDKAGVAMTDGLACGEAGAGHTRFIFAMPRPVLVEALERIAAALPALEEEPAA